MVKRVVIDYGHGGIDSGCTYNGLYESEIVFKIGEKVVNHLKTRLYMYRTRVNSGATLLERTSYSNTVGADLFVSLHVNDDEKRQGTGIETHIYGKGGQAERVAKIMQSNLVKTTKLKDRGIKVSNFAVLRDTKAPAILIELGFIHSDMDKINHDEVALCIANSILQFYRQPLINEPRHNCNCEYCDR